MGAQLLGGIPLETAVNAVQGNNRCLFSDPHKTHKHPVWAERGIAETHKRPVLHTSLHVALPCHQTCADADLMRHVLL